MIIDNDGTRRCGRDTGAKRAYACRQRLTWAWDVACAKHRTPEEYEQFKLILDEFSKEWQQGYEAGVKQGRQEAEYQRRQEEIQEKRQNNWRLTTADGRQIVTVEIEGGRELSYAWPVKGAPLCVGDRVILPENWLSAVKGAPGPFEGVVVSFGTSYDGELQSVLRKAS